MTAPRSANASPVAAAMVCPRRLGWESGRLADLVPAPEAPERARDTSADTWADTSVDTSAAASAVAVVGVGGGSSSVIPRV